jgi:hypothetical protein
MTSPPPDWVDSARRFLASSGLVDALAAWGGPGDDPGASSGADGGTAGGEEPSADSADECRWCPLCVALAALRGRRPDLLEGLADVLGTAAAVLRAHAENTSGTARGQYRPGQAPAEPRTEEPGPPAAPVQRIEVA